MTKRLWTVSSFGLLLALASCQNASTSSDSSCTSGSDVTETPVAGGLSCITNISADAPDWIKNNFHCMSVKVCSTTYQITTNDLPPYKTAYYGSSSPNFVAFDTTGGRFQNPNTIATQNITLTIPRTPTYKSSGLDATQGAGIDVVGISTIGVVYFNNQAAPGDSLATEYQTMDGGDGHPQNTGKYHNHTEPIKITSNDSKLIGIALDGYPIYGKKTQAGTYPTLDSQTNSRACTTTEFPSGTYCYHVANGTGVNGYVFSTSFRGTRGSTN